VKIKLHQINSIYKLLLVAQPHTQRVVAFVRGCM